MIAGTLATVTKGQTFKLTEPGHKFEGRTLTVKSIGTTGHTLLAVDVEAGSNVYLYRTPARVELRPVTVHTGPPCLASDDDEHVPVRCTRDRGHDGDHEADDGEVVVSRWTAKEVQSSHTPAA